MAALHLALYDVKGCCGIWFLRRFFQYASSIIISHARCRVIIDHCMRQRMLSQFIITRGERDCGIIFTGNVTQARANANQEGAKQIY
jgi:hypothetical protein